MPTHIPVLGYHQMNNPASYISVNTSTLTMQMEMLKYLGYKSITPLQYVNWLRGVVQPLLPPRVSSPRLPPYLPLLPPLSPHGAPALLV